MADLDPSRTYRAAVIGSGSAGLTIAIGLAGFGHEVVLIEAGRVGGDCTNVGCIPSKSLLHAAAVGIDDPFGWTRSRRDSLSEDEELDMANHDQIALVRGWARLTSRSGPHVVAVTTGGGDEIEVRADHVVICSGSSPAQVPIEGLSDDRLLTNEDLFDLEQAPDRIVLVGGGPISLEMATAFRDLGSEVAIVEMADRLLPSEFPEVSETIRSALAARGVAVHLSTSIERFDPATDTAVLSDGGRIEDVDVVLLAIGRRPKLDRLGLDEAGVDFGPRGIDSDDWGRTNVDGIWAVGDVTGRTLTTHGANAFGRRTVRAIALPRLLRTGHPRVVPSAVYSRPEVASVGMSVDDVAARRPVGRRRYTVDLADLDRGHTDEIEHGIVVVDVERFTGKILRAAIVAPAAADSIGIFTMAIDHGIGLRKIFGMVHPYPSHVEAIGRLADDFARETYPALPREWWAMVRGRVRDLLRR